DLGAAGHFREWKRSRRPRNDNRRQRHGAHDDHPACSITKPELLPRAGGDAVSSLKCVFVKSIHSPECAAPLGNCLNQGGTWLSNAVVDEASDLANARFRYSRNLS
ncbi:MAG: hypothetical protein RL015_425, partial [Verrucomicrobiota bacterium]